MTCVAVAKENKNTLTRKDLSALVPQYLSNFFHKKFAFTLAELLITLGIIGIVAALTLPQLIVNYQKQATANKVKKFYTNFSQAIRQAEVDNGEFKNWDVKSADELYDNYLAPYLKVVQVQRDVHVFGNFIQGIKFIFPDGTQAICNYKTNLPIYGNHVNLFPCIFFTRGVAKWTDNGYRQEYKYNGPREIFWFLINQNGQLVPPHMEQAREYNINSCKTMSDQGNGFYDCGTLLYKDGWQIKDDYPW